MVLNFRHVLNDYGILDNKLHVEVLAQSNGSGNGNSSGGSSGGGSTNSNNSGGSNIYYYNHLKGKPDTCKLYGYKNNRGEITYSKTEMGVGWTKTGSDIQGMYENCPKEGSGCTVYSCHLTGNTGGGSN